MRAPWNTKLFSNHIFCSFRDTVTTHCHLCHAMKSAAFWPLAVRTSLSWCCTKTCQYAGAYTSKMPETKSPSLFITIWKHKHTLMHSKPSTPFIQPGKKNKNYWSEDYVWWWGIQDLKTHLGLQRMAWLWQLNQLTAEWENPHVSHTLSRTSSGLFMFHSNAQLLFPYMPLRLCMNHTNMVSLLSLSYCTFVMFVFI